MDALPVEHASDKCKTPVEPDDAPPSPKMMGADVSSRCLNSVWPCMYVCETANTYPGVVLSEEEFRLRENHCEPVRLRNETRRQWRDQIVLKVLCFDAFDPWGLYAAPGLCGVHH
jgi:hypothetical protein